MQNTIYTTIKQQTYTFICTYGKGLSMAFQPKVGRYVLDFGPTSLYMCPDMKVTLAKIFFL